MDKHEVLPRKCGLHTWIIIHVDQLFLRLCNPCIVDCAKTTNVHLCTFASRYPISTTNEKIKFAHNPPLADLGHLHHIYS